MCLFSCSRKKNLSRQQPVVLDPFNNQIFSIHLHCLIAIFTSPYYYIYNDLFSVIYWTEWCNLDITQLLFLWIVDLIPKLSEKFTNYFYELQILENICQIIHKLFINFKANNRLTVGSISCCMRRVAYGQRGPPACAAVAVCLRWTLLPLTAWERGRARTLADKRQWTGEDACARVLPAWTNRSRSEGPKTSCW